MIFCSVTNQAFTVSESDVRRRDAIPLVIGNYFNFAVYVHTDARMGGAQIDADNCSELFRCFLSVSGADERGEEDDCCEIKKVFKILFSDLNVLNESTKSRHTKERSSDGMHHSVCMFTESQWQGLQLCRSIACLRAIMQTTHS